MLSQIVHSFVVEIPNLYLLICIPNLVTKSVMACFLGNSAVAVFELAVEDGFTEFSYALIFFPSCFVLMKPVSCCICVWMCMFILFLICFILSIIVICLTWFCTNAVLLCRKISLLISFFIMSGIYCRTISLLCMWNRFVCVTDFIFIMDMIS